MPEADARGGMIPVIVRAAVRKGIVHAREKRGIDRALILTVKDADEATHRASITELVKASNSSGP